MVKGYKVFNPDWTCRDFQYTCPGTFEEDVEPSVCECGFHFCVKAADCFQYYSFDPNNKVAEIIALGNVVTEDNKSCTNKIQIVREVPWAELLGIVNTGNGCSGLSNSGHYNSGYHNSGCYNICYHNSGNYNSGSYNSGFWNSGNYNTGDYNSDNYNSGSRNCGKHNSGDYNNGSRNSGNYNNGNHNSGDWNKTSFSSGCFCTKEPKILLFNKPSNWTLGVWRNSDACYILRTIPASGHIIEWVCLADMTEQEKAAHPEAETTGGYLKDVNVGDNHAARQTWWDNLDDQDKSEVMAIPNFDKEIFKEITGIDVG